MFKSIVLVIMSMSIIFGQALDYRREKRTIFSTLFGGDDDVSQDENLSEIKIASPLPPPKPLVHYPIWKVHKYNGINMHPLPISLSPNVHQQPLNLSPAVAKLPPSAYNYPISQRIYFNRQSPNIEIQPESVSPKDHYSDLAALAKSVGIHDISNLPSMEQIMDLLGTKTPEETINTVRQLASTQQGVDLIMSYLMNNSEPKVIRSTNAVIEQNADNSDQAILPQSLLSVVGIPNNLDRTHTNLGILRPILSSTPLLPKPIEIDGGILQSIRSFFTLTPTEEIPIEFPTRQTSVSPSLSAIKQSLPSIPTIDLPELPIIEDKSPNINGIENLPQLPPLPAIKIPEKFQIAHPHAIQGTYVKVRLPLNNFDPLPSHIKYPQASVQTDFSPIHYIYPTDVTATEDGDEDETDIVNGNQYGEDIYESAANEPIQSIVNDGSAINSQPQRLSSFDSYANGQIRYANLDSIPFSYIETEKGSPQL